MDCGRLLGALDVVGSADFDDVDVGMGLESGEVGVKATRGGLLDEKVGVDRGLEGGRRRRAGAGDTLRRRRISI